MRITIVVLSILFLSSCASKKSVTKWYKGNTHTHSYWSDGDDFPEMIMDWYKSHHYDFIALSDHNILAEVEKWKEIPVHPFRQKRFQEYLKKYGPDWVKYKTDTAGKISVKLKMLEEYRPLFEEKGKFLIIKAEEITDGFQGKPVHINAINVKDLILPKGGNSIAEVIQNNLDQVWAQRERTGQPMFPHLNHPNFGWAVKIEDMMNLKGERFFEVYNGHPHVHNYGDSATIGMDELWDKLLIHYIQQSKPLLYGLATDDSHHYLEYKVGMSNPGRGWIMVKADSLTPSSIINAMEKGDFYSTTGVELKEIKFTNGKLDVSVNPAQGINYTIQFWGANGNERKMLKEIKGTEGSYTMAESDLYVRAKIISSKLQENPFQNGDVETAWTQPIVNVKK